MSKRIYLSGPMTGLPEFNYPLFHRTARRLREEGHFVFNPAEYPYDGPLEDFPVRTAFADYAEFICLEATAIYLLPGWQRSQGALAEVALARVCRLNTVEIKHEERAEWPEPHFDF